MKQCLAGLTRAELRQWAAANGEAAFRGSQIADWMYRHFQPDPNEMNNLPAGTRRKLAEAFYAPCVHMLQSDCAPDGTEKLLAGLTDDEAVEMVLIPGGDEDEKQRLTFCLSTQVGCPVGCLFCASGRNGLVRNLKAGEMVGQFLLGCRRAGRRPDNLVFMGIGEGLCNFEELSKALQILTGQEEFAMSPRRITVSTSGFVPGMQKFAALEKEFTLAISLHAADDETRSKIIPGKVRYPIAEIMAAADLYLEKAGRMVTFEYTLLDGINDRPSDAEKLAKLAMAHHAKVNLIPYNSTGGEFKRPAKEEIRRFRDILASAGAHVTIRQERGAKSSAACGQLRAQRNGK